MKKFTLLLMVLFFFGIYVIGCRFNVTNPSANEFKVQIVGDSVFDLNAYIHKYLKIFSGKSYKDNSVSGSQVDHIVTQFRNAINSNPGIKTIIMDGGANDILQSSYWKKACATTGTTVPTECQSFINGIGDKVDSLWDEMDAKGVVDIMHLGYYHLRKGSSSGTGVEFTPAVDYADTIMQSGCFVSPADCNFIDSRPRFNGNEAYYIKSDGIHPTDAGGKVLADLIWKQMVSADVYR